MSDFQKNNAQSGAGRIDDFPPGSGAVRLDDLLGLPPAKQADPPPGSGAVRLDDLLNPPVPPVSPERQAFEAEVAHVMQIRGPSRREAEIVAFENILVEFLNATHPDTDPNRCARCGGPETPDVTLLPIGVGHRHAWLHRGCWEAWRAQRRVKAEGDLARLGVVKPGEGS
jgi:hypothetical protein